MKNQSKTTKKPKNKTKSVQESYKKLPSSFVILWRCLFFDRTIRKYVFVLLVAHIIATIFFIDSYDISRAEGLLSLQVSVLVGMMYIWLHREVTKKKPRPSFAAAFYEGTTQFVPFSLLTILATVQIIPFAIGAWIFQLSVGGGVAIYFWEQVGFGVLWFILALPSMYWLSATLLGMVVVTIPGVRPLEAWRAGRRLVRGYVMPFVWRISFFLLIAFALVVLAVLGSIYIERIVFATNIPTYVVPFFVVLFWNYTFMLYRELLDRE